jgi:cytochrome c nitrite reductase small subunit
LGPRPAEFAAVRLTVVLIVVGGLLGIALGIGGFTFIYAKGYSYLTNDPAACANCHVMGDYYAGWMKGPHRSVAVCNDCHAPHDLVGKYATKASNGFWHSFYFTTGQYPDHLEIKPRNRQIANDACLYCHEEVVHAIVASPSPGGEDRQMSCVRCHWDVGHMK